MQATPALDGGDVFRQVKRLEKEGKTAEALARLRELLRHGGLDAGGYERAGRMIRKALRANALDSQPAAGAAAGPAYHLLAGADPECRRLGTRYGGPGR